MSRDRNRLYLTFGLTCIGGYIWLFSSLHSLADQDDSLFGGCLVKHVTGIPCPSCGVTRSLLLLIQGDLLGSIAMNPWGLIVAAIMLILPLWLLHDLTRNKRALFETYQKTEKLFRLPQIYIPSIALVVANWMWNIVKGL